MQQEVYISCIVRLTRDRLAVQELLHWRNVKPGHIGVTLANVLSSSQDLLCYLRGDWDPGFTDQSSEESAHSPEVLDVN